jgi:hypothetical protein
MVSLRLDKYKAERIRQKLGYMPNETKTIIIWGHKKLSKEEVIDYVRKNYVDYDVQAIYEFEARKDKSLIFLVNSRRLY